MLEGLPVWVVIRLCTNEKKVTEFYNQIDEVLEFNLEVLDDFSKYHASLFSGCIMPELFIRPVLTG